MREIKFRGKSRDNEQWVYGGVELQDDRYAAIYNCDLPYDNQINVMPWTVGQCTGLKDLNGKEIFEGDIVKHNFEYADEKDIYKVVWSDYDYVIGRFELEGLNKNQGIHIDDTYDDWSGEYALEVIGNIYENPELSK